MGNIEKKKEQETIEDIYIYIYIYIYKKLELLRHGLCT